MCDRLAPNPKQGSFGVAPRDTQGPDAFGPGPGHYHLKTCVGDTFRFSMRGRETFGNPTGKSDDPTTATEPGPGQYPKVDSMFEIGTHPRVSFRARRMKLNCRSAVLILSLVPLESLVSLIQALGPRISNFFPTSAYLYLLPTFLLPRLFAFVFHARRAPTCTAPNLLHPNFQSHAQRGPASTKSTVATARGQANLSLRAAGSKSSRARPPKASRPLGPRCGSP
jgi:hypothetical protein